MTVEEIYEQSIRPLPAAAQRRLVEMIARGLARKEPATAGRINLADLIEMLPPGPRRFRTWEEYDRALQAERDSWDYSAVPYPGS
jgi:hypothetical protein